MVVLSESHLIALCELTGRPYVFAGTADGAVATLVEGILTVAKENQKLRERVARLEKRAAKERRDA